MRDVCGFVSAEGTRLLNGEGREILLRGVGLGSWLLPEGYMWHFPEGGDRPRRIERMVQELLGEEKSKVFWELYYENYISEEDIRRIAEEGFNSVRVPINSRFLFERVETARYNEHHLGLIDRLIGWCKKHSLYVILDLHGAPGGQTGTNIDDSENDRPELFLKESNKWTTIEIWRRLAERYRDEWIVAGYDLLNEPLPEWFSQHNGEVMPLYKDIIKAIREEDKRHMIILEGVHWATDWSIFTEKIDGNLMLEFHKYWNNPDVESLKDYLDKREELDMPIFMGEGGENNKEWYVGAFKLFENLNISWNFWTWKKMDTTNSPCSIIMPSRWNKLIDYLNGGSRPEPAIAEEALWQYLENMNFNRCVYHKEVVNSIFSRPPLRIPSVFYDYKGEGKSYEIKKKHSGSFDFRVNDGTCIGFIEGERKQPNFHHGRGEDLREDERLYIQLSDGEWAAYELNISGVEESTIYSVHVKADAVNGRSYIIVTLDGEAIGGIEAESGVWSTMYAGSITRLRPGKHELRLCVVGNPARVEGIEVNTEGE